MKSLSLCRLSFAALSLAALSLTGCSQASDSVGSQDESKEEEVGTAEQALEISDLAYKTIYLNSQWGCPGDSRCNYNLGWSGTPATGKLFAPNDTAQLTPWLVIPVPGKTDEFYLQNKWHCATDGRCMGDRLSL
jgi:hypothetical protein